MTINEAKKDLKRRLNEKGLTFERLSGKTVSFEDLARVAPVFITIHGANFAGMRELVELTLAGIPKPSQGGYIVNYENCKWS
jgi:hypothetical protein